ncbi:MAG: class I SAM-dependent rRNA methyltransferase [Gemmataceae bacterium]
MPPPRVILKPKRAQPFFGRHPWVFAGAIADVQGEPADGTEVDLYSHGDSFIARGIFNAQSKIRVRLYSWDEAVPLERDFFRDRLAAAIRLRRDILGFERPGSACRLVFSEADGLSGLTVDRYDRWLAVQFTALGLAQRKEMIAELLLELTGVAGIYQRTERGVGKLEGLELHDEPLKGSLPVEPILIDEHGLSFAVDLGTGQKTGFYLDQRDNRQAVAKLAAGRRVLDAFCYSGGFGLHAARAGAKEVLGVDVSEAALDLARANAARNGLNNIDFIRDGVFERLEQLAAAGERFGLVVLDPPKFARARHAIEEALRGYRRLQTLALRLLEPDGILVTCCCSGLITMEMLDDVLAQVAVHAKRDVQILERRGQSADHPIAATCLETGYLKCLIARVG